jgi:hypothetical protein
MSGIFITFGVTLEVKMEHMGDMIQNALAAVTNRDHFPVSSVV